MWDRIRRNSGTDRAGELRQPVILNIERQQIAPDIEVLEMSGRIVLGNNSRDVELKLAEILRENRKKIIFDIGGITLVDSTGIGILVVCQGKIAKAGGALRIAGATGLVDEILKITNVDKILHLFPTVADAVAGFQ
jgi:anti-sigma B factor antagonist